MLTHMWPHPPTHPTAPEQGSLGLRPYSWWNEASHGVTTRGDVPTTNLALPLTIAQSFNRSLWHANGQLIGRMLQRAKPDTLSPPT